MDSIELTAPPRLFRSYVRGVCKPNRYQEGQAIPRLSCVWKEFQILESELHAYQNACALPTSSQVPICAPHALLGRVHVLLMGHVSFPVRLLGALHWANDIRQYQPLAISQRYKAELGIVAERRTLRGLELDIQTRISQQGYVLWESVSTYLFRLKLSGADVQQGTQIVVSPATTPVGQLACQASTTQDFARVTGDVNPIHLSRIAARCFGYKRNLAHGMWALARGIQLLPRPLEQTRCTAVFKGPLYVGETISVFAGAAARSALALYSGSNPRPSIVGRVEWSD